ncbi:MAG: 1-(5-phosphoribosyl)-5-[(5-phosphoribosylamino)methylideneamino] imidazole-4-carboxamide isomerase [Anaerolineae bacterium]|nr:1-(5-phosphoribosyl)-5-[(5-phosphoribosylamino)methylideneamino] imidazole-4-carboxamide isomerase [Gemmatimonadaceae bacterium]
MIAYAAIDLRGGRVVQLVGGRLDKERISLPDPVAVASQWVEAGFAALHVVDLDAAFGVSHNRAEIRELIGSVTIPVQVGGGVRSHEVADELIEMGAQRIVVGTRVISDPEWLAALVERLPDQVVVAADVRGDEVVTHGWTQGTHISAESLMLQLDALTLAAVLVTDVSREGRMTGADVARFSALAAATRHALIASGGIASVEDLRALAQSGVAGAVLGMSLYTGTLDARAVATEFAS